MADRHRQPDDCGGDRERDRPREVDYPCERCHYHKPGVMMANDVGQYLCGACWARTLPPRWEPRRCGA